MDTKLKVQFGKQTEFLENIPEYASAGMQGCLAVCRAHRYWYSVLFTVCFISLLYLDLYVLGDDALIS